MIAVQGVLISDDIVNEEFVCNLNACKGACCWEGDYGAPLTKKEQSIISENIDVISEQLSIESVISINEKGPFSEFTKPGFTGASLHKNGSCVFMVFDENGTAQCGIEKTYELGKIDYLKPTSCHLYPIRIVRNKETGFEAWNYDQWEICSAACDHGKKLKMPIYKFLKQAIIRLKGKPFYEELDAAAKYIKSKS